MAQTSRKGWCGQDFRALWWSAVAARVGAARPGLRAGRRRGGTGGAAAQGAAGDAADLAGAAGDRARERLGAHGERLRFFPVEHEAYGGVVDAEVGQVVIGE